MRRTPAKSEKPLMRMHKGACVVLCSRGRSFEDRLREAVRYAEQNAIEHILLLHCPEKKYSEVFVRETKERADRLFSELKAEASTYDRQKLCFEVIFREGLLEDNLALLIAEGDVKAIFIGAKMFDYRPEAIKKLQGPAFYFLGD